MAGRYSVTVLAAAVCFAQPNPPLGSLKSVPIPQAQGLDDFVRDRHALQVLGKALFWDMQAGSDGRTACATCHFHAGADHRRQNQISDPNNPFPANHMLEAGDFPFRKLADPANRNSFVLWDTERRVGSAGVFRRFFDAIRPGDPAEMGQELFDLPGFLVGGLQVRSVTARNSPSVINAVFNVSNFWDGRASRFFNGFDPSGAATPGVLVFRDGQLIRQQVRMDRASLASQATGPALDSIEMSYAGRGWPALGRKMFALAPLALQRVASDDSLLGPLANPAGPGLREGITYRGMVEVAFSPALWQPDQSEGEFTQAEHNFGLFWGLAILAYESVLVSSDAPFDRFMEGDGAALNELEREGFDFFRNNNGGRCAQCHSGPEFTDAAFGRNGVRAFQRNGVRRDFEDAGRGNGNFKTSGLRNVELTGPYFHNGGQSTLEQVIEFYSRGGDFAPNNLRAFALNDQRKAALVAFLNVLTDERVRFERAPFDHPELCVPDGHAVTWQGDLQPGDSSAFPRSAQSKWVAVPAVGAAGNPVPLQSFEELLTGTGAEAGLRAHNMREACAIPLP